MKVSDFLGNKGYFTPVYPHAVMFPINNKIIRKNAVGVYENWDSTATERFIQSLGEVSAAAYTHRVIRVEYVINKLDIGGVPGIITLLFAPHPCPITLADDKVGLY